jgi:hypothetical protein
MEAAIGDMKISYTIMLKHVISLMHPATVNRCNAYFSRCIARAIFLVLLNANRTIRRTSSLIYPTGNKLGEQIAHERNPNQARLGIFLPSHFSEALNMVEINNLPIEIKQTYRRATSDSSRYEDSTDVAATADL